MLPIGAIMISSKYNFIKHADSGLFIYNVKSGAIINIIDEKKIEFFKNNQIGAEYLGTHLYQTLERFQMITPSFDVEFSQLIERYRNKVNDETLLNLTIMPTENCNFACPYCFQYSKENNKMSRSTYGEILKLIKKHNEINTIFINWFGGEPSLCFEDIFWFMQLLQDECGDKGLKIKSSLTTNGYLLDDVVMVKLVNHNIKNIQVTIDGGKESHDKTRILKSGKGTYDVIMNNLKKISALPRNIRFKLEVRCNFTKETCKSVESFIETFSSTFKKDKRFSIYCRPVYFYKTTENTIENIESSIFSIPEGIEMQNNFSEKIKQCFNIFSVEHRLINRLPQPTNCWCNAELKNHFIIGPNGEFYICDTLTGKDNIVGNIIDYLSDVDSYKVASYDIFTSPLTRECMSCKILPLCMCGCLRNRLRTKSSCYWTEESIEHEFNYMIDNYIVKKY